LVTVRAPASTSNLGPGFDCFGAALSIGLELTARESETESWEVSTPAPEPPSMNVVLTAAAAVAGDLPTLSGQMQSAIPIGAGLGSSAAAIAAGLLLGCAIAREDPDPAKLLALGTPIEGHPDNLAAALYGGLTLALPDGDVLVFELAASVRPLILLPHERMATKQARGVLGREIPRADAVANIARASGLLAVLNGAAVPTRERLLACTEDLIHQPQRGPLMPRTQEVLRRLRAEGIPAAISGAGPALICLVVTGEEDSTRDAVGNLEGWELLEIDWDTRGAHIVEGG
jgi:homoserine kinase